MAHSAVVSAFRARLATGWTRCPVQADVNIGGAVPATPFIEVQFPVSSAAQKSVGAPGSNIWREEGGCLLTLHVERQSGADAWLPWIDELADLFRGKSFAGVQTSAPNSAIYSDENEDGQTFKLRLAIPYQFDLIG
jgi:hypothetical protein